jgi:hypothetical protein
MKKDTADKKAKLIETKISTPVGKIAVSHPFNADKKKKIWSLYADYFGEVNAYRLTYDEAVSMVVPAVEEDGFVPDELTVYAPYAAA